MADYAALADAERLRDEAAALLAAIEREIVALEAALEAAREGVEKAERTGRENAGHAAWLGGELEVGRSLAARAAEALAAGAAAHRELAGRTGRELARQPGILAAAPGGTRARRVAAALPVFRAVTRERLATVPLRSTPPALESAWRELADDYPALGDRTEEALRLLGEAETSAAAALERARAGRPARTRPRWRPTEKDRA